MSKHVGIVAVGGDCPGSNAALRGFGKAAMNEYGMQVTGFFDGFEGMSRDEHVEFGSGHFSGILTSGGTILGTSRELPTGGQDTASIERLASVFHDHHLDSLVVMGGSNAQIGAHLLSNYGLPVLSLPLTIDNDLPHTDTSIGFDSAMNTAAEAIDRLHSTAYSQHRMMIVEVMGKDTGWLTLGAGVAGGADVILIPELPFDENEIAEAVLQRKKAGKRFSIVAVSEGAISQSYRDFFLKAQQLNERKRSGAGLQQTAARLKELENLEAGNTIHLASTLERLTGLDTRITILGYLQRGGSPTAADRALATQFGSACAEMAHSGQAGCMLALQQGCIRTVPLEQVAGGRKSVPMDHDWLLAARRVGTCLGG